MSDDATTAEPVEPPTDVPADGTNAEPVATEPPPLHDDPDIAKALSLVPPEKREALLTTGGKNALAARLQEAKDAKADAAQARAEIAQQVGKALGLVDDDATPDPAELTNQLETVQADHRRTQVELAVFRASTEAGGDPAALLDSRSFLATLDDTDPTDSAAVTAAIKAAVEANPRLGVAPASRLPAPNPAQGSSANGAPTLSDQIADATAKGDFRLTASLKAKQLAEIAQKQQ